MSARDDHTLMTAAAEQSDREKAARIAAWSCNQGRGCDSEPTEPPFFDLSLMERLLYAAAIVLTVAGCIFNDWWLT